MVRGKFQTSSLFGVLGLDLVGFGWIRLGFRRVGLDFWVHGPRAGVRGNGMPGPKRSAARALGPTLTDFNSL